MRNELEIIERIEHYLKGELSPDDKVAFEKLMADDAALQEAVRLQREIREGIERAALKQKIQQARIKFKRRKNFYRGGLTGLGILILSAAIFYFVATTNSTRKGYEGNKEPEYNELGEKKWADADKNLPAQTFLINASRDTVIETKDGITLSIPANCFLTGNNKPATGELRLVVKEALDPATIMKAGLSTRSGDQLLETGGMFFVDARKDRQILKIDPSHGIYAEIPTDTLRPDMQLYQGTRRPDGTIDWLNPRPLEHDLIPVDIHLLNFYPPHYLDSLAKWGYPARDKKFTDSLYYSFARLFGSRDTLRPANSTVSEGYSDSSTKSDTSGWYESYLNPLLLCGINPAKIKTIWNEKFQNTLLSTREFEERMALIHASGSNEALDLYVNNLDKNLSDIDSMAGRLHFAKDHEQFPERFYLFYMRHDGKVKIGSKQFQKLREYYEMKVKVFTEAISKTQHEFWNKQAELDNIAGRKKYEHKGDSLSRLTQNFMEEFNLNLKNAYHQLGYDSSLRPPGGYFYRVEVSGTGWNNVDRAVEESTLSRSTLDYTDPQTGRKATIAYLPFSLEVEASRTYDRLYVYLLPSGLSSFMRLSESNGAGSNGAGLNRSESEGAKSNGAGFNGKYREKLNELMGYKLVCIAYKGDQAFVYSLDSLKPKDYGYVRLSKVGKTELDQLLNRIGSQAQGSELKKEQDFFDFENIDGKRQKHNQDRYELTNKVMLFLFPCFTGKV